MVIEVPHLSQRAQEQGETMSSSEFRAAWQGLDFDGEEG